MATMEQAFEMVEKLTEELAEKEERLMKLEKQLEESEKQKKELFNFKEIIALTRHLRHYLNVLTSRSQMNLKETPYIVDV